MANLILKKESRSFFERRIGHSCRTLACGRQEGFRTHQQVPIDEAVNWSRGVTVSTLGSESSDRGSNPRETFLQQQMRAYVMMAERKKQ